MIINFKYSQRKQFCIQNQTKLKKKKITKPKFVKILKKKVDKKKILNFFSISLKS